MATNNGEIPDFKRIRPSPTNPHKRPTYIEPGKIRKVDGTLNTGMSQKEEIKGYDQQQTHVLQPWTPSRIEPPYDNDTVEDKKPDLTEKEKQWKWWIKFGAGITVILVAVAAAVFFFSYYENPHTYRHTGNPSSKSSQYCTRSHKDVSFNDILMLNCVLDDEPVSLNITFNPEYGSYRSVETLHFSLNNPRLWEQGWNISKIKNFVNITKPPAKCNSGGHYTFVFVSGDKTFNHTEFVTIKSKLSDVSLEVEQSNETDSGFYQIKCSARSGCTPAPISLLGIFTGEKTEPIFGVNFTCLINYNDDDGWTVSCTGTVPDNVYSSLNSIACRPTTGNKKVDDEKEIKYTICRDCIFECPKSSNDTYWYDHQICNIFHRCSGGVLYTQPCPPQTYFSAITCACDHTNNLPGKCDKSNKRVELLPGRNSCEYEQN